MLRSSSSTARVFPKRFVNPRRVTVAIPAP
jgi:hypothetical protein